MIPFVVPNVSLAMRSICSISVIIIIVCFKWYSMKKGFRRRQLAINAGSADAIHSGFLLIVTRALYLLHNLKRNCTTLAIIEREEHLGKYVIWRDKIKHCHTRAHFNGIYIAQYRQCSLVLVLKQRLSNLPYSFSQEPMVKISFSLCPVGNPIIVGPTTAPQTTELREYIPNPMAGLVPVLDLCQCLLISG